MKRRDFLRTVPLAGLAGCVGAPSRGSTAELLVRVDVDLRDGCISLRGQTVDDRFEHLAGTAPVGVEVREDDIVVGDNLIELRLTVDVKRLTRVVVSASDAVSVPITSTHRRRLIVLGNKYNIS